MRFDVDDQIYAKWPASHGQYFPAKVIKVYEDDEIYRVQFEADGTKMNMDTKSVMSVEEATTQRRRSKSRSPARTRSRSPARTRSPGRGRGKQSPSRAVKTSPESKVKVRALISSVSSTSSNEEVKVKKMSSSDEDSVVTRRRSVRLQNFETKSGTMTSMSKTSSYTRTSTGHKKSSGFNIADIVWLIVFNVLAIIGMDFLIKLPLYVLLFCDKRSCDIVYKPEEIMGKIPRKLSTYYSQDALLAFNAFMLLQAILHILPLGEVKTPIKLKMKYRLNMFPAFCITIMLYCLLVYLNFPVAKFIYNNLFRLTFIASMELTICSFIIYAIAYFNKEKPSPYATGVLFPDILLGRTLHTRFGMFDLKLYLFQAMLICWTIMNLVFLQLEMDATGTVRPLLMFVAISQILSLSMNFIIDEERFISGFDMQKCGSGMASLRKMSLLPVYTLPVKYIYEHPNLNNPSNFMAASMAILCLVGLTMRHLSNRQKQMFRLNPYDPKLAGLESIRSPSSQRLLVSGFWGMLRRPSYLGDLLIASSWSLACGCDHYMVWLFPVILAVVLVQRTLQDEKYCAEKHGHAWEEYCKRVPYRIIPFVF